MLKNRIKTEDNHPLIFGDTYYYQDGDDIRQFILGDGVTVINLAISDDDAPILTYFEHPLGVRDLQCIATEVYKDKEILKSNMINTAEFDYTDKVNRIKKL